MWLWYVNPLHLVWTLSPSYAEASFVRSTRTLKPLKTMPTLSCWYSLNSSLNEYQHCRVKMVFKNLCILVPWTKVASALQGLILEMDLKRYCLNHQENNFRFRWLMGLVCERCTDRISNQTYIQTKSKRLCV